MSIFGKGVKVPLKHRISFWYWSRIIDIRRSWDRFVWRHPRLINEGEATARVLNMAFDGYPLIEKYETKEQAVEHLARLWDLLDDWDGSRVNVRRLKEGLK